MPAPPSLKLATATAPTAIAVGQGLTEIFDQWSPSLWSACTYACTYALQRQSAQATPATWDERNSRSERG